MIRRFGTTLLFLLALAPDAVAQRPLKIFISVDMEGIGGIGTSAMTNAAGKDYALGRRLMTDEVNAVIGAILQRGPAEIHVNDSHGDMQNLLHTELDPRVTYTQGAIKPLGMVEGLDSTFSAAIFLGYHSRAGTPNGFLAHTGTGSVKGLWLNDTEVGEGELLELGEALGAAVVSLGHLLRAVTGAGVALPASKPSASTGTIGVRSKSARSASAAGAPLNSRHASSRSNSLLYTKTAFPTFGRTVCSLDRGAPE